ncbi:MAG: polysaccharide deacetylase family protein [Firmicutes bacterium]|nr:polysaccharide deacetylase family protein [Bacillota bacterium]
MCKEIRAFQRKPAAFAARVRAARVFILLLALPAMIPAVAPGVAVAAPQPAASLSGRPQGLHRPVRVPVLMYHEFGDSTHDLFLKKEQFKAQIQYLKASGYHAVALGDLYAALKGKAALPQKPVVLTFDDGYLSHYEFVYPVMKENGMRGVFFVMPGFVGKDGYASWEQLAEMAAGGMEIESHSFSHPDMRLVAAGPRLTLETLGAREEIERRLSREVRFFCYPAGRYDRKTVRALQRAGYLAAFTTANRWLEGSQGLFALPRLRMRRSDTLESFAERLKPPAAASATASGGSVFHRLRQD